MKEDRLIHLLESLLGKSKNARGGDEAVFSCPNCNHHKKKLTFNKYTQKFQCWVCGFKGARAIQLLKFIKDEIKKGNQSDFERIILQLAYSKKELTYLENKALFSMGVLETEDYLNDNIEGRYFKKDFGF